MTDVYYSASSIGGGTRDILTSGELGIVFSGVTLGSTGSSGILAASGATSIGVIGGTAQMGAGIEIGGADSMPTKFGTVIGEQAPAVVADGLGILVENHGAMISNESTNHSDTVVSLDGSGDMRNFGTISIGSNTGSAITIVDVRPSGS